jgi:hypothetical protein
MITNVRKGEVSSNVRYELVLLTTPKGKILILRHKPSRPAA